MGNESKPSPRWHKSNARGIATGIVTFIFTALCWRAIAGFLLMWFLPFDPSKSWWEELGYFLIIYIPSLLLVILSLRVASRMSGRSAGIVASLISVLLILIAILAEAMYFAVSNNS